MNRTPILATGLVLATAAALLDVAGLAGLFVPDAPPAAVVIASAVLGAATLAATAASTACVLAGRAARPRLARRLP